LVRHWNKTKRYFNDFACASPLCTRTRHLFDVPNLFRGEEDTNNFLLGPRGSGLPFHQHTQTWQGLAFGRKGWYVVPSDRMSASLDELVGTFAYPVRAWHDKVKHLPVGQRPLYCEQNPGEIIWIPDRWWHATINLMDFTLARGAKPKNLTNQANASETRSKQTGAFREEEHRPLLFEYVRRLKTNTYLPSEHSSQMSQIQGLEVMERKAAEEAADNVTSDGDEDGGHPMGETAAFTFCVMSEKMAWGKFYPGVYGRLAQWLQKAKKLDAGVYSSQCPKN